MYNSQSCITHKQATNIQIYKQHKRNKPNANLNSTNKQSKRKAYKTKCKTTSKQTNIHNKSIPSKPKSNTNIKPSLQQPSNTIAKHHTPKSRSKHKHNKQSNHNNKTNKQTTILRQTNFLPNKSSNTNIKPITNKHQEQVQPITPYQIEQSITIISKPSKHKQQNK